MSAARHRREEGDLGRAGDGRPGFHMPAVERGADHAFIGEGRGIILAALLQPGDEIGNRPTEAGGAISSSATPTRSRTQAK